MSCITVGSVDWAGDGVRISDDELTALAMAADPDQPVDPDARPISRERCDVQSVAGAAHAGADVELGAGARAACCSEDWCSSSWVIDGAGLCVTYGLPEVAW